MRSRGAPIGVLLLLALPIGGCSFWRLYGSQPKQATLMVNIPSDARWTQTTVEAATTPQQRKVLREGRPKTIVGEVVDVSCYLQLGKRGEPHIPCGQKCIRNGQPIGVVTDDGALYLIVPEEHHPRRDGNSDIRERFAELIGKRVQISGMSTTYHNSRALFIRSLPSTE